MEDTPKLNKKQSQKFLEKVFSEINIPIYKKPTPKLAEARKLALNKELKYEI